MSNLTISTLLLVVVAASLALSLADGADADVIVATVCLLLAGQVYATERERVEA